MPCVALGQKKYCARPVRKRDRKIRRARLVSRKMHKSNTKDLIKTAQTAVEVATSPKAQKICPPQSAAIRLKDGDQVQIRQHRVRPAAKPASRTAPSPAVKPAPVATSATSKSTRALQKSAKASKKLKRHSRFHRPSRADLINAESRLGSMIFGPIPAGHRREFFHDRENIWIWHESWVDAERHARQLTIRYEVRPSGVYKKISAGKYFRLEGAELENFRKATRVYLRLIKQYIYGAV